MSEVYLDNQEVTTEELNNIAIDLGIPEFNGFGESKFGVDLLNRITADLSGKGVLNILEKCKPILTDNTLSIAPGVIVFESGAKLRLEDYVSVAVEDVTTKSYVYAVHSSARNTVTLNIETAELTSGDYVLLCEIENGTMTDKRLFARSRLELGGDRQVQIEAIKAGKVYRDSGEVLWQSIALFSLSPARIFVYNPSGSHISSGTAFIMYDLINNRCIYTSRDSEYHIKINETTARDTYIRWHLYTSYKLSFEGDKLNIYVKVNETPSINTEPFILEIL